MNKTVLKLLLAPAALCFTTAVHAQGGYVGAKAGVMSADVDELDNSTNIGLVIGYEFNQPKFTFAIEGEYTFALSEGDADLGIPGGSAEWDVTTIAVYGVMKIPLGNEVYVKGKVGYLNEDITISTPFGDASDDESGGSLGAGLGFKISDQVTLEAEYTVIEEDLDFFSAGANFFF